MPLPPKALIAPPPIERYTGGLYSAAPPQLGPVIDGDPDRWLNGLQFQAETCAKPKSWAPTCIDDVARVDKEFTLEFPDVGGTGFVEYLGVQCALVGHSLEDYRDILNRALGACEQNAVERTFWTGDMGNSPRLVNDPNFTEFNAVIVNPVPATPMGIVEGIAALESRLADEYCGVGVLHAPRGLAPYAANLRQIEGTNPRLTTVLGTRWAFGAGYSVNTGPDGVAAPTDTAWIYATSAVQIYRSSIWMQPDVLEQAFRTRTNFVEMLAERGFVITVDCPVKFAALVQLDCQC